MPPVLGPLSPSPTRLKSWAGSSGTAVVPSHRTSSEHSSPVEPLLNHDAPPGLAEGGTRELGRPRRARASARVRATSTPLPAASPSVLTTHGPGQAAQIGQGLVDLAGVEGGEAGRRHAGLGQHLLHEGLGAFERAPSAPGPMTARPSARRRSARPSTSGASGPMTTRSASISSTGAASVASIGAGHARVARRHHHLGRAGQHMGQRVLAAPAADDADPHGTVIRPALTRWRRRRTARGPGRPRPGAPGTPICSDRKAT